jgi:hypothetical protein
MGATPKLTPVEMYNELINKGLLMIAASPVVCVLPTAYHYIPTHIVYASTAETHAELEPSSSRNKEKTGQWINVG